MTVSSSTNRVNYNGDDSTTVFAYAFKVFDQDDLTVILRSSNGTETVQTITTNYTVSGVGDAGGGNVTMVTAPATGEQLTILREQPLTQGLDLVPNDPFPANSIEESLDKITFMVQKHEEELGRAIKASRTNTISGAEFTVSASDRANKVFAFDSSGDLAVTQELGTFRGDWAASTAYSVRDLVKDTSTNNIFIVNSAHTSSGLQPLTTNANSAKYDLIVDAASATTSATNAATSAAAALASETAAAASETAAATSESNAASSASAASTSETNAATSATNAATSESNAAGSESAAATSETNAATSATNASTSASAAATSATNAATSETAAAASQAAAATSATTATTQATAAATSATNAATSETNAATSEVNAATSETNAATSATAAAASQVAAAASAASAASAYDSFDDRYLGPKTSDPTLDNDGNALVAGALYFNSTANEMRVYDGANWIAASSAGGASLLNYNYTATSGQTTFSGADDNAATLSYTQQNLIVTLNGIVLEDGTDYTASNGTSVVLASGAAAGDELNIVAFKSFTTADMVPASTGGTFSGNVTMEADLTVAGDAKIEVASGGIYTITGTDTATDRTITLPDQNLSFLPPTIQVFTSSGTWTAPAGCRAIEVTVVGGGGGGGGVDGQGSGTAAGAGGGGGGGSSIKVITSDTFGSTETVTIGSGGSGGSGDNDGSNGASSSFGAHCSASGGNGGAGSSAQSPTNAVFRNGGLSGEGSGGDLNLSGGVGMYGSAAGTASGESMGGSGGNSYFAGGGIATSGDSDGTDAPSNAYGGGGGGASVNNITSNFSGGTGGDGVVIVKEYY